jgi:hypothetical protein
MIRILVPTGIGDVYWVMTKLQSFCKKYHITEKPSITILTDSDNPGYLRTVPFLEMIPFIQIGELPTIALDPVKPRPEYIQKIYEELYTKNGRTVYPGLYGYDYFISYNGIINSGNWLESCDDLECNWNFDLIVSDEQQQFRNECKEKYGKYAVFYWTFNGNYIDYQLKQFSLDKIAEAIKQIVCKLKSTPVFIGAYWDLQYNDFLTSLILQIPNAVNLVGQTSLDQVFGVIQGSELVMGYHSGITNMAVVFKKKTVLLWPSSLPNAHQWPASIPLAVVPRETRNTTYKPQFTGDLTVEKLVTTTLNLYEEVD